MFEKEMFVDVVVYDSSNEEAYWNAIATAFDVVVSDDIWVDAHGQAWKIGLVGRVCVEDVSAIKQLCKELHPLGHDVVQTYKIK